MPTGTEEEVLGHSSPFGIWTTITRCYSSLTVVLARLVGMLKVIFVRHVSAVCTRYGLQVRIPYHLTDPTLTAFLVDDGDDCPFVLFLLLVRVRLSGLSPRLLVDHTSLRSIFLTLRLLLNDFHHKGAGCFALGFEPRNRNNRQTSQQSHEDHHKTDSKRSLPTAYSGVVIATFGASVMSVKRPIVKVAIGHASLVATRGQSLPMLTGPSSTGKRIRRPNDGDDDRLNLGGRHGQRTKGKRIIHLYDGPRKHA